MTTERVEIGGLDVEVVRKAIKNLHVGVYPPDGRVRVAAPTRLSDEAVRLAVVSRLPWIRRQQRGFLEQDRQSQREMVTGESHYVFGRRYLLDVVEGPFRPAVTLADNATLRVLVRPGTGREAREAMLSRWYREQLKARIPAWAAKWQPKVGRTALDIRVQRMKTRWGSCNPDTGRILLNLELAKKPEECAEYLLVHELVHLVERHHSDRFRKLLSALMPNWQTRRDLLNRAPLAHEEWQY